MRKPHKKIQAAQGLADLPGRCVPTVRRVFCVRRRRTSERMVFAPRFRAVPCNQPIWHWRCF